VIMRMPNGACNVLLELIARRRYVLDKSGCEPDLTRSLERERKDALTCRSRRNEG
jgi:hypothetical protein